MSHITLDAAVANQLNQFTESVELRDPTGRVLGRFIPLIDMNEWEPDEHVVVIAPAVAISKPPDIHTTQAVTSGGRVGLIDFFSPVRWDFSNVDGMVVNRAEYPMLGEKPPSYAGVTTVYAPDDPRAALNRMSQRA